MALIDAKGKILGVVNVIDGMVALIATLLVLGYVMYAHHTETTPQMGEQWDITLLADHPEIAAAVHVGDTEQRRNITIATVKHIRKTDTALELEIRVLLAQSGTAIGKQGQLKIGTAIGFDFPQSTVNGVIIAAQRHNG